MQIGWLHNTYKRSSQSRVWESLKTFSLSPTTQELWQLKATWVRWGVCFLQGSCSSYVVQAPVDGPTPYEDSTDWLHWAMKKKNMKLGGDAVRVGLRIVGGEMWDLCDQNTLHACMKISNNKLTTSDFIPNGFKIMNMFKIITPRRIHRNKMLGHQTSFHLFQNFSVSQMTTGSQVRSKNKTSESGNLEKQNKIQISHTALNRCI